MLPPLRQEGPNSLVFLHRAEYTRGTRCPLAELHWLLITATIPRLVSYSTSTARPAPERARARARAREHFNLRRGGRAGAGPASGVPDDVAVFVWEPLTNGRAKFAPDIRTHTRTDTRTHAKKRCSNRPPPFPPTGVGRNKVVLHNHLDYSKLLTPTGIRIVK